jgi:asparagine synthetase B (glutamine-hydrolysing)
MRGSVLHLRGPLTPQPLIDGSGNMLLWNGEIYDGIDLQTHDNDTAVRHPII